MLKTFYRKKGAPRESQTKQKMDDDIRRQRNQPGEEIPKV